MFRDRTVFKALLDDFTAYLLHGSHGTLGSIKTRPTTDTSTLFSSTKSSNPSSVQSTRRNSASLHANTCSSFSLLSPGTSLGKADLSLQQAQRSLSPHTPPRAGIYHRGPRSHRAALAPATAGPLLLFPSASAPKLSDGRSPQGLWKDLLQMQSPPQSRLLQLCWVPVERQLPPLPSRDYPVLPAGGSTESLDAGGNACFLQPGPGTLSPYGHIRFLPESLARETRAAAGCLACVGRDRASTEDP